MPSPTRSQVSAAFVGLMPSIMRGMQLDFFVKKGVTQTQFLVLIALQEAQRPSMSKLSRSLHVSMPTATGIIDRLVRAGYVRRVAHPDDRRQVVVELTAAGQRFIRGFQEVVRRRWEDVLRALDDEELDAFHRVITALRERLQTRP